MAPIAEATIQNDFGLILALHNQSITLCFLTIIVLMSRNKELSQNKDGEY